PEFPLRDATTPYVLVNYVGQGWTHQRQLVSEPVKGCNQCHRIGTGNTMRTWAPRTVGRDPTYDTMVTDAYRNDWHRSHHMPFDPNPNNPAPLPSADQWDGSPFAKAIQHIQDCLTADPNNQFSSCKFADIPREPADIGSIGECWSDIADDCDY